MNSEMTLPFQRLLYCPKNNPRNLNIILAASGGCIHSFNAANGGHLASWSHTSEIALTLDKSTASAIENTHENEDSEPAAKRRRLSPVPSPSASPSPEIIVAGDGTKPRRSKSTLKPVSSILKLCVTSDGKYVVAATAEDKSIRVLELLEDGLLRQRSERQMAKRPSSIALTTDEKTILCADKFGDVYALPLLGLPYESSTETRETASPKPEEPKQFVPAATNLTVHTKRNQETLRNQQKAKAKAVEKKTINFEHRLLLGHVSLLTDLAYITVNDSGADKPTTRSYIATADRDEHIRISRGLTQAHIIEGYCLAHTQFVSKLCVPWWSPKKLISGGGDDFILMWDWLSGYMRQKIDIRSHVDAARKVSLSICDATAQPPTNLAVSGLWAMDCPSSAGANTPRRLFVGVEGLPALLIFVFGKDDQLSYEQTLQLEGNLLDVIIVQEESAIVCSIDTLHAPHSTSNAVQTQRPVLAFHSLASTEGAKELKLSKEAVENINAWAGSQPGSTDQNVAGWSDILYGVEHLRKRGNEEERE